MSLITPYLHQKVTLESARGYPATVTSSRIDIRWEDNFAYVTSAQGRKVLSTAKVTSSEDLLSWNFTHYTVVPSHWGYYCGFNYDFLIRDGTYHFIIARKTMPTMEGENDEFEYFVTTQGFV
jgi:hypothetical protein